MFGDVLAQKEYGFFSEVEELTDLMNARILLPQAYAEKLTQVRDYYMAMNHKLGVAIGSEHSMHHSR